MPLHQYQAYAAYWQMRASRIAGGGFVADEMGLGKTLEFYAYVVAERQLSWLWEDVHVARSEGSRRHLQKSEQHEGDRCPSWRQRPGYISCPCASSSLTSGWLAKGGVRLACVPESAITQWVEEWKKHVDVSEPNLALRLVIAHDPANPIPAPSFDPMDARHARNMRELSAPKQVFDSKPNTLTKYLDDVPRLHQDRFLVVTTTQSYKTWVKKFEYKGQFLTYSTTPGDPEWGNGKGRGIVFGIAMIDECHEEYIKQKGRSGVLSDLPLINNPFIWGYSGTPLSTTPRSLEGVLWAMEQHFPRKYPHAKTTGWETDVNLRGFRYKAFDALCKDFEDNVKNQNGNLLIAKEFEESLLPWLIQFVIRRTADSTWFGRPLIMLKNHIHQDVILAHNPRFDASLAELTRVIDEETHLKFTDLIKTLEARDPSSQVPLPVDFTFNQRCRVQWKLSMVATFPFLVELSNENHPHHLSLATEEVIKYMRKDLLKSPYARYLKQIVKSSAKCIWLEKYLLEMLQTEDVDGKEQKLVIITRHNQVALILKLVSLSPQPEFLTY